jgi:hypothetical protein
MIFERIPGAGRKKQGASPLRHETQPSALRLFYRFLQGLSELIGAGSVFSPAMDTRKASYDLADIHPLHQAGYALKVAGATVAKRNVQ